MPATWPETLPQCPLRPTQQSIGDDRIKSPMQVGVPKMRPGSSATPDPFSGSFKATGGQIATLTAFVKTELKRGTLPFTYPAPRGGDDWLVRFRDLPSWDETGPDTYLVALSLDVLP